MRKIKREKEEIDEPHSKRIKLENDENLLLTYEKMPTAKVMRMEVNSGYMHKTTFSKFQCKICQKYFKAKQGLNSHMKSHFTVPKVKKIKGEVEGEVTQLEVRNGPKLCKDITEHQCKICHKYFAKNLTLQKHLKLHYKPLKKCEKCNKTFKVKNCFHNCIDSFKCLHCDVKLSSKKFVREHMRKVHNVQTFENHFMCDFCGDSMSRKVLIEAHFDSCVVRNKREFSCDHCGKSFQLKCHLSNHIIMHAVHRIECNICHLKLKLKYIKRHMEMIHKEEENFQCKECSKVFKNLTTLRIHSKIHNKKFQCTICDAKYRSRGELGHHMVFHDNPEKLQCKICGLQLKDKKNLKFHMKTHDKDRQFNLKCQKCDYKTDLAPSLTAHMKTHERLDKKSKISSDTVKCEKCNSVLKNKKLYKMHLSYKHGKRKNFHCDLCEKVYLWKRDLKLHLEAVHFKK